MFVGIRAYLPAVRTDACETQEWLNHKDPVLSLWAKLSPTHTASGRWFTRWVQEIILKTSERFFSIVGLHLIQSSFHKAGKCSDRPSCAVTLRLSGFKNHYNASWGTLYHLHWKCVKALSFSLFFFSWAAEDRSICKPWSTKGKTKAFLLL